MSLLLLPPSPVRCRTCGPARALQRRPFVRSFSTRRARTTTGPPPDRKDTPSKGAFVRSFVRCGRRGRALILFPGQIPNGEGSLSAHLLDFDFDADHVDLLGGVDLSVKATQERLTSAILAGERASTPSSSFRLRARRSVVLVLEPNLREHLSSSPTAARRWRETGGSTWTSTMHSS